ncbi:MAG: phosphosulfolactate synthase, partial [Chloroflexota bacterium]
GGGVGVGGAEGELAAYLGLCADMGVTRVECGAGFTEMPLDPQTVLRMIHERGMQAQFELGQKHSGTFTGGVVDDLLNQGRTWLDAGAVQLVIEARESACGVGVFDTAGQFQPLLADKFASAFGLGLAVFEAPNKPSQFALLNHFGPQVQLCNVRLEEILRVEIYRRGIHSDAFLVDRLRPPSPVAAGGQSV